MRACFIVCLALLVVRPALPAQEQDLSKVEIKVTKVAGNIYLLQGGEGGPYGQSDSEY
jgi:hypothetical protein